MPIATTEQAKDEMLGRLKAALDASAHAGIDTRWDNVAGDEVSLEDPTNDPPPPEAPAGEPWLRAGVRHADGRAASLGSGTGSRRFTRSGTLFVQVFIPSGGGTALSDSLVDVILNAYRAGGPTAGGIQFSRPRSQEVGASGAFFQTNCLINFEYDQIIG